MSSDHALLPADAQSSADAGATEFQEHGLQRQLSGFALKFVGVAALLFSTYQLTVAAFAPLSSLITRSLHVGFLLMIVFVLYPAMRRGKQLTRVPLADWVLAATGFALAFYQWIFESDLIQRAGDPTLPDLVVGTITIVLVFEAARRVLGFALRSRTGRMRSRRSSTSSASAPKASTAFRPWCRRPTSSCSSCSAPSSSTPA